MKLSCVCICFLCLALTFGPVVASDQASQRSAESHVNSSNWPPEWNGIVGRVIMTDGTSPGGVEVVISDTNGTRLTSTLSTDKGDYTASYAPPATYIVSASKPGYYASPAWGTVFVETICGGYPGPNFKLSPLVTITGILKDKSTGLPIRNGIVQAGERDSQPAITDATGAFSFATGRSDSLELFADALGYHHSSLVVSALGDVTQDIELTPQPETGVIVNGGFEDVSDGKPVGWEIYNEEEGSTLTVTTDCAAGAYAAKITAVPPFFAVASQEIPVLPGSAYNIYYKLRSDAGVSDVITSFEFTGYPPSWECTDRQGPLEWTQLVSTSRSAGSFGAKPLLRVIAPPSATGIRISFGQMGNSPEPKSIYIDDVVVDRVEPEVLSSIKQAKTKVGSYVSLTGPNIVTFAPKQWLHDSDATYFFYIGEKQGLGGLRVCTSTGLGFHVGDVLSNLTGFIHKSPSGELYLEPTSTPIPTPGDPIPPVGMSCKSVLTDPIAQTNRVRIWGKATRGADYTRFTITDGHSLPVTVYQDRFFFATDMSGKTVSLIGIVGKDDDGKPIFLLDEVPRVF